MLPFPILNQYGNVIIKPNLKDMQGNYSTTMLLLYDDGRMYGIGNSRYLFGDGVQQTYTDWYLIRSDIKRMFYGGQNFMIIQTIDDKYYISGGRGRTVFPGSALSTDNTWVECTTQMQVPSSLPLSKIYISRDSSNDYIFGIDSSGTLYSSGYASSYVTGTGSDVAQAWKQVLTNVKNVSVGYPRCTWAVTNDNKLYRCGTNSGYVLGTGSNVSTTLTTFTLFTNATYNFVDVRVKGSVVYMRTDAGQLCVLGNITSGAAGNGVSTGSYYNPTLVSVPYDHVFDNPSQTAGVYMFNGTNIMFTGNSASYGGINQTAGTGILTWTAVIGLPPVQDTSTLLAIAGGSGAYVVQDGKLYGTGHKQYLYNYNTASTYIYTFVELPQPV